MSCIKIAPFVLGPFHGQGYTHLVISEDDPFPKRPEGIPDYVLANHVFETTRGKKLLEFYLFYPKGSEPAEGDYSVDFIDALLLLHT